MPEARHYSPRIARPLITQLYHEARARGIPMTVLVNRLIADGLAPSLIVAEQPAADPGAVSPAITHPQATHQQTSVCRYARNSDTNQTTN